MSDSVQPQRWQPTRLPRPWDSPDKNTGVGCHVLLQCMKVKSESEVAQSCQTLSNPMDCSPPAPPSMGFSRHEYWSSPQTYTRNTSRACFSSLYSSHTDCPQGGIKCDVISLTVFQKFDNIMLLLLLLSRFNRVRLCATP